MKRLLAVLLLTVIVSTPSTADSYETTQEFYDWFLKAGDHYRKNFDEARPYFTDELYGLLVEGFDRQPDSGWFVDFDPFANAQMQAERVNIGKPVNKGPGLDMVVVTPVFDRGGGATFNGDPIKVYLKKSGDKWQIANLVYAGDYPFELKQFLREGLGR